ncbi:MAG: hypothetical protein Kow0076_5020 [Francisella sp.]
MQKIKKWHKGFSIVELLVGMTVIIFAVLSYEYFLFRMQSTNILLQNKQELMNLASNRYNEYLATGNFNATSTTDVTITQSGSVYTFTSNKDPSLKVSVSIT